MSQPRVQRFAASFAQQRLWFIDQYESGTGLYNIPAAWRLLGALDVHALQQALNELVRRHETLRTVVRADEGQEVVQVVAASLEIAIKHTDLAAAPEPQAQLRSLLQAEANAPFDLSKGPLVRCGLVRLAPEEHVLLLTMHHIVSDGWSMGVMARELQLLYAAFTQGQPSPLTDLPIQYADYAVWQREWLQGAALQSQVDFWRKTLEGAPPLIELPLDRPRPAQLSHRGGFVPFELDATSTAALRKLCQQAQVTAFMAVAALLNVLLHRYSRQDDICLGYPVAGRQRKELEGLIGFFVNTLVLRTRVEPRKSFLQLLAQVRESVLDADDHQDLPFEKLVEELKPERSLNHSPLFQIMLAYNNATGERLSLPGLEVTPQGFGQTQTAKFDLTLELTEAQNRLLGAIEYNSDLFDRSTIERMVGHFKTLLEAVVANPQSRVQDLPLLTEAERHQILVEWNDTKADFPQDRCIHQLFEEQVERSPDAVALVFEDQQLTYARLNAKANQLAHHLRGLGVKPDTLVAICVERSLEMVIGLLGILKAGGAYVPLDPDYPEERLAFMLQDTAAPVLLTQDHLRERLPQTEARAVCIDLDWGEISDFAATNPETVTSPLNLAYCIYTSGSTGSPKGVQIEHGDVARHLLERSKVYGLGPGKRCLQFASINFDVSVEQLFSPLACGGSVVLRGRDLWSPQTLLDQVRQHSIGVADIPTAYWHEYTRRHLADLESLPLEVLIVGGEAAQARQRSGSRLPIQVINAYGPTEATITATQHEIKSTCASPGAFELIGRPTAQRQAYVLDGELHPVPIGVPGELHIAGAGLARGYLNRPDLTAEKFIPNPFGAPGSRMYKTGDLARYLLDGNIEFLGRLDHQVKVRGFRIELGEVEAAVQRCVDMREAVVVAREDEPGDKRLVAYVVPVSGAPAVADLRTQLSSFLPEYMVPTAWVFLDALPLNPNGKIDRNALPAPELSRASLGIDYVAPRNSTEELLAGIWAEVLKVERIGVHDNFFAMGGHSLLATQVVSRIRTALNTDLPLRALFEAPSLAALADRISALRSSGHATELLPSIRHIDHGGRALTSFAQQRLWFIDQYESGSGLYNVPAAWRLQGALDVHALQQALNELVRRHEALRTVVLADDEQEVVQVVAASFELVIEHADLSAAPEPQAQLRSLLQAEANAPFDLSKGPLVRCGLVRLAPEEHVLLLTMHHIVSDGWSMGVLARELQLLYGAFAHGQPSPLTDLPIQYADYALWQREWLQGAALQSQVEFWRKTLEGAPPLIDLPLDRPRPAQLSHRGAFVPFELDASSTAALRRLCQQAQVTSFMAAAALLNVLLHRYSRQDDICLGYPVAGRQRKELEGLIGFFVNTLVLRTRVEPRKSFLQLLAQVRESVLDADDHQDLPFEKLVEELKPERSLNHSPLFQIMLAYNNATGERLSLPGLEITPQGFGQTQTAKFDLTLELTEAQNRLLGAVEYNSDLFDRSTIERMVGHFKTLLAAVVANPQSRVQDLPLLTEAERHQILVQWNDTKADFPQDKCIHQLFEEQVERSPDAVAVVFEDQQLTYAQLNAKANQLARHLRDLGVKPDTLVAICVERSLEMVIGLMGILKAGGAYVPLDPDYPEERLAFMLQDTNPTILISQEHLARRVQASSWTTVLVDSTRARLHEMDTANMACIGGPQHRAYCLYTSGSTGLPKGVELTHGNAVNFLAWATRMFGKRELSRVACTTSICFDLSVFELFGTLLAGGTIVLLENALSLLNGRPSDSITIINTVPSAIDSLTDANALPADLQVVNLAGEPLKRNLANRVLAQAPGVKIFNLYGPTEYTTYATAARVSAGSEAAINVGRPIANTRIYILDADQQIVPTGVAGEIFIGGKGLARGYLQRPDLTASQFVPDPFEGAGERMYKTGDIGRFLQSGEIEFIGRDDHQVKLRGFRIELGEIQSVLERIEGVHQAMVVARRDTTSDMRLVAYIVPKPGARIIDTELQTQLSRFVPDFMVPSAWVQLGAMPLNPNGKIDRKSLPEPGESTTQEEPVHPRNDTERAITRIWEDLLRVTPVGIHDDFFAIGGHSLLAARLLIRIQHAYGTRLSLADFLRQPTVAAVSEMLAKSKIAAALLRGRATTCSLGIVDRSDGPRPLGVREKHVSRTQAAHWSLAPPAQRIFRSRKFVVTRRLQVANDADPNLLASAIVEALKLARVFGYRLKCKATGEVIADPLDPQIPVLTCDLLDEAAMGDSYQRSLDTFNSFSPDAYELRLVWTILAKPTNGPMTWLLSAHHIVVDEATIDLVQMNAERLYAGLGPLQPTGGLDFYDYADWTTERFGSDRETAALLHWAARVRDCPRLRTGGTLDSRPPEFTGEAHVARRFVPRGRPSRRAFPVPACLPSLQSLAILAASLSQAFDWSRFVVGTLRSERELLDEPHLAGYFVNAVFYVLPDLRHASDRVAEAAVALLSQWAADTEHFWLPAAAKMGHLPNPPEVGYVRRNQIDFYYRDRRDEVSIGPTTSKLFSPGAINRHEEIRSINDLVVNLTVTNEGVDVELIGYKYFVDEQRLQGLADAFRAGIEDVGFVRY